VSPDKLKIAEADLEVRQTTV